jgi:hypothetical protein
MTTPDHPDTADVYITNATGTSAGNGPGQATLPWDEAKALVDASYAVYGSTAPLGLDTFGPVGPP